MFNCLPHFSLNMEREIKVAIPFPISQIIWHICRLGVITGEFFYK